MKLNDKLWDKWKRLVYKVAKKRLIFLTSFGYELEDVIQVGAIGLIKGVSNYNKDTGYSEVTFFYKCIDNEILKEVQALRRDKRLINKNAISIETSISTDSNDLTLLETISDDSINIEKDIEDKMMKNFILCEMKNWLNNIEYEVLYFRVFMDFTFSEISQILGLEGSYHARKIEEDAKKRLITHSAYFKSAYHELKKDIEAKLDFKYQKSAEDVAIDRLTILNKFNLFKEFEVK